VSPFGPPLSPAPDPFPLSPRAVSPLSTAFTPNRPLTPLSTAFTQIHRGVRYQCDSPLVDSLDALCASLANPFFSDSCALLNSLVAPFATPILCFQQLTRSFAKTPGWGVPRHSDIPTGRRDPYPRISASSPTGSAGWVFFAGVVVIRMTLTRTRRVPRIVRGPRASPPRKYPTRTATNGFT
jgi:hypothetical protein